MTGPAARFWTPTGRPARSTVLPAPRRKLDKPEPLRRRGDALPSFTRNPLTRHYRERRRTIITVWSGTTLAATRRPTITADQARPSMLGSLAPWRHE